MKQFETEIIANKQIAPEHYILSFKSPRAAGKVSPGQFFNIKVDDSLDPLLRRPFSAHRIEKNRITILYKVVGKATRILAERKRGELLDVLGPLGNGFEISHEGRGTRDEGRKKSAILVAGGHGIAPLCALAERLAYSVERPPAGRAGIAFSVFIGAKSEKHIVCEKEFKKLGVNVHIATDDGSRGHKGLITDLVNAKLKTYNLKLTTIYACGPKPMLKVVAEIANRHKIPCQVSMEEYLGCGTGVCMGCAIPARNGKKLVCKDGPVFRAEELVW